MEEGDLCKAILNFIKILYYIQIQLNGAVEKGNHPIFDKSTCKLISTTMGVRLYLKFYQSFFTNSSECKKVIIFAKYTKNVNRFE